MKLGAYTVTVRISDPNDEETAIEATFHNSVRENLLAMPLINTLLKSLEESVADDVKI